MLVALIVLSVITAWLAITNTVILYMFHRERIEKLQIRYKYRSLKRRGLYGKTTITYELDKKNK